MTTPVNLQNFANSNLNHRAASSNANSGMNVLAGGLNFASRMAGSATGASSFGALSGAAGSALGGAAGNSVGDLNSILDKSFQNQTALLGLQQRLQDQNLQITTSSNIAKIKFDTNKDVSRNIRA